MKNIIKRSFPIILLFALVFLMVTSIVRAQQYSSAFDISAKETRKVLAKDTNVVLLDVRSPQEYAGERIANSPLMPLQYIEKKIRDLERYKNKKIIVYCRSGNRSELAVEILREYGFNALNMQGGILQWKAERFPTMSGPRQ